MKKKAGARHLMRKGTVIGARFSEWLSTKCETLEECTRHAKRHESIRCIGDYGISYGKNKP